MTYFDVEELNEKLKRFDLWVGYCVQGTNRPVYLINGEGVVLIFGEVVYFTDDEILQYIWEHGIEEFATVARLELNFSGGGL